MKNQKRLLIVDGSNYLFRGHFSNPSLTNKQGMKTNAIKGFLNILIADVSVLKPTHLVVAFDIGGPSWRREIYPEYKATRAKNKDNEDYKEAIAQARPLRELLRSIGIRLCCKTGQEADDLIGTIATNFMDKGYQVILGSKDKDFAQLVTSTSRDCWINMLVSESRNLLDDKGVKEKFGVYPHQIIDYLALIGDKSDNIPGVNGCGAKTASKLLTEHKTLQKVIKNKSKMTPKLLENFELVEPLFPLTKQLLTIKTDIELKVTSENSKLPTRLKDEVAFRSLCKHLNLKQTQGQLLKMLGH